MSWLIVGASAAISVGSSLFASSAANASGIRNANAASRAEGEAIAAERLNTTLRNSYDTAFQKMQLAMTKRKLSQQVSEVRSQEVAAQGVLSADTAAVGAVGASVNAAKSDIDQKAQQAVDAADVAYDEAADTFNSNLQKMVINTQSTAPVPSQYNYQGASSSEMIGSALLSGLGSFASAYAIRSARLGLQGTNKPELSVPDPYEIYHRRG